MNKATKQILALSLVLLVVFSLAACRGNSETTSTVSDAGDKPAETGTTSTDSTAYEIKLNIFASALTPFGQATQAGVDAAEAASDGRLKFTVYWDGTYVSYAESVQSTINGVVDMCYIDSGNVNESFLLNQITSLPVTCDVPSRVGQHEVFRQAMTEIPELEQELNDVGLTWIGMSSGGSHVIHLAKDVTVRNPEDLRGMSIDSPSGVGMLMTAVGASPVSFPATDFYTNLERGVTDGMFQNWSAYATFNEVEVTKAHTIFATEDKAGPEARGLWACQLGYIMNKAKYDSLPADLQQIIQEVFGLTFAEAFIEIDVPMAEKGLQQAKDAGHTFTYLNPDQVQLWKDKIAEAMPTVIDRLSTASGKDAEAVYAKWCELLQTKYDEEGGQN